MDSTGTITNEEGIAIEGLKLKSFEEYIAAKCLFLNDHLEQAVSISNTCLEKQMKAALLMLKTKVKRNHNTPNLLLQFRESLPNVGNQIKVDFMKRIFLIHELRYFDSREKVDSVNFFISRNFYLAELDFCFSLLEACSTIKRLSNKENPTPYAYAIKEKDPKVFTNNYLLQGIDKLQIFDGQDYIEPCVILAKEGIFKWVVNMPVNEYYSDFTLPGITVNGNEMTVISPSINIT